MRGIVTILSKYSCLKLQSLSIWLKYYGVIGSIICNLFYTTFPAKDTLYFKISLIEAYYCGYRAMLEHESQMIWFRKLYLIFSIYMTFNILKLTNKSDQ